jgi:hypothetical protein
VLVWSRAPLLFPNELMAIDGLAGEVRAAEPGDGRERPLGSPPRRRRRWGASRRERLDRVEPVSEGALAGWGGGRVGSGWTVLGGELAVPCTRNPL